jgi:WD40 repeat protein
MIGPLSSLFLCFLSGMALAARSAEQDIAAGTGAFFRSSLGEGDPRTSSPITALAFSSHGDLAVAGCKDGSIHVWATTPFGARFKLSFHTRQITSLSAAPTQALLASASDDGSTALWDLKTGKRLRDWKVDPDGLRSVSFSPNSQQIVTAGRSTAARLWDVDSGTEIPTFRDPSKESLMAQFSPRDKAVTCCRREGQIDLLDADTGKLLRSVSAHAGWVASFRFSPDGKTLTSYGEDGFLKIWNTGTWQETHRIRVPHAAEIDLAYSADGAWIAMCGNLSEPFRIWEVATGREIGPIHNQLRGVSAIAFSAREEVLAAGGADRMLRWWRREQGLFTPIDRKSPSDCWAMDVSGDGTRIVFAGSEAAVYEWDLKNRRHVGTSSLENGGLVTNLRYGSTKDILTVGCEGGTLGVRNATSGAFSESRPTHDTVRSMTGSLSASHLIAGLSSGIFIVWDIPGDEEVTRVPAHKGEVRALDYCAGGTLLVSGGTDGFAKVWDCATWKALRTFREHQKDVSAVAGGRANDLVASADWSGRILLWRATTGDVLAELRKPSVVICMALCFSPDDKLLAAGGNDGVVTIYEVATMKELTRVGFDKEFVRVIRFLPSGFTFAAGLSNGRVDILALKRGSDEGLDKKLFAAHWEALKGADLKAALDAIVNLRAAGRTAVSMVSEALPPVEVRPSQIADLVKQLDSENPIQRGDAFAQCELIGPHPDLVASVRASGSAEAKAAIDRLKPFEKAKPSSSPSLLRFSRAVLILESMGSPEAMDVLARWSKGAPSSPLTRDATAALARISATK